MPSIQARLATGLLISLISLLIAQWVVVERSIGDLAKQYIVSRLVHGGDLLVAALIINNKKVLLDDSRLDPVYRKPFSGFYFTIDVAGQEFRSRSLWDEHLKVVAVAPGDTTTVRRRGPQDQELLVVTSAYKKNGQIAQVVVAEDVSDINRNISSLLKMHALLSLFILVVLILIQVAIVRRGLQPLDKARRQLDELENGLIQSLDEKVPKEIFALVHEVNLRIAAFQQRLERSRRVSGNLAHALKRPLTLLSQLAQDSSTPQHSDYSETFEKHIDEIKRIIERELSRARMAGTAIGGKQSELRSETQSLIKLLQTMYVDKSLNIELLVAAECYVSIDREDFHELMGNILDNACKWAKHQIRVTITNLDGVIIRVEDDGPGIPVEQLDRIMKRGTRLDEQVDGHGLGLSIVKDILEQYQGCILMQKSEDLGGLSLTIQM